jgi:hypothetical protein
MNTTTAILLVSSYITAFLLGRLVGIMEAKETIMKILKKHKIVP